MIYTILPTLKFLNANGEYKSITLIKSLKITRDFYYSLLSKIKLHNY